MGTDRTSKPDRDRRITQPVALRTSGTKNDWLQIIFFQALNIEVETASANANAGARGGEKELYVQGAILLQFQANTPE